MLDDLENQIQSKNSDTEVESQLLKLYSTLWETYSAKKAHSQQLENENEVLRATNIRLCQERLSLENRISNQESMLVYFEKAFEKIRHGILSVFKDWEADSPDLLHEIGFVRNIVEDTGLAK